MEQHPYLWILKADPAKYIRTTSSAFLALLKAAEGVFSLLAVFYTLDALRSLALRRPLPAVPARLLVGLYTGTAPERILLMTALAALSVCMLCAVAEGFFCPVLRFAMEGAGTLKRTRQIFFYALLLLTAAYAGLALLRIYRCLLADVTKLPGVVIPAAVVFLLLMLALSYARGSAAVCSAIEYEFRLGFKQTELGETKLSRDSFLLGLLFIAAAFALWWAERLGRAPMRSPLRWMLFLGLMAVKYFAVFSSFAEFQRCHK